MLAWTTYKDSYVLNKAVLSSCHTCVLANPHHALDRTIMRYCGAVLEEEIGLGVRSSKIEHSHFLLLPSGQEM